MSNTSRRESLLTLATLHGDLAATHRLIAEEYQALAESEGDTQTTPDPPDPIDPIKPPTPVRLRLGQWVDKMRIRICGIQERPDRPQAKNGIKYFITDVFTTRDGAWEPSGVLGSVDQWARDTYLRPFNAPDYFDDAGAATHLFAAVIGLDGKLIRGQQIIFWSDGLGKLADPTYQKYVTQYTKEKSGWCNLFMSPSASFVPERGESGPWCWCPPGASDVLVGGGLPARQHVSTFAVWQAVRA